MPEKLSLTWRTSVLISCCRSLSSKGCRVAMRGSPAASARSRSVRRLPAGRGWAASPMRVPRIASCCSSNEGVEPPERGKTTSAPRGEVPEGTPDHRPSAIGAPPSAHRDLCRLAHHYPELSGLDFHSAWDMAGKLIELETEAQKEAALDDCHAPSPHS